MWSGEGSGMGVVVSVACCMLLLSVSSDAKDSLCMYIKIASNRAMRPPHPRIALVPVR